MSKESTEALTQVGLQNRQLADQCIIILEFFGEGFGKPFFTQKRVPRKALP